MANKKTLKEIEEELKQLELEYKELELKKKLLDKIKRLKFRKKNAKLLNITQKLENGAVGLFKGIGNGLKKSDEYIAKEKIKEAKQNKELNKKPKKDEVKEALDWLD